MTDANPYSTPDECSETAEAIPHTSSLRGESWRGFKLGVKLTAIAMTAIVLAIAIFTVGTYIYLTAMTSGDFARSIEWLGILRGVGGSIAAIAMMSLYGGVAGAIVMGLAAILRKLRRLKGTTEDCG